MTQPAQEKVVDALAATPFVSVLGINFMNLNELLETATLAIGFITGLFVMFFQIRRWYRGRKRDQKAACSDNK